MAFNLKRSAGELYNKGVIKARELRDEQEVKKGLKVAVVVERADGKRLLINTYGVKGRVHVDDYDEERVKEFLGHDLGTMRDALKSGKKWVDNKERVTFDFSAPERTTSSPKKPKSTKTPKWRLPNLGKGNPSSKRLAAPKSPNVRLSTSAELKTQKQLPIRLSAASELKTKKGYYSWTLGRWVN